MTDKAKLKHKTDRWLSFPQQFSHEGQGSAEDFVSALRHFRYMVYGKQFYPRIEEIEIGKEYHFLMLFGLDVKGEREEVVMRGSISALTPERFVVEATSLVPSAALIPIRNYSVQSGCVFLVLGPLLIFIAPLLSAFLVVVLAIGFLLLFPALFEDRKQFLDAFKYMIDTHFYLSRQPPASQWRKSWLSNEKIRLYRDMVNQQEKGKRV